MSDISARQPVTPGSIFKFFTQVPVMIAIILALVAGLDWANFVPHRAVRVQGVCFDASIFAGGGVADWLPQSHGR